MAFGFPASHKEIIKVVGSRDDARAAVVGTLEALSWTFESTGPDFHTIKRSVNLLSWGETMTVWITDAGTIEVTSKCLGIQCFDWGRNAQNVTEFIKHFSARNIREAKFDLNEPKYIDESGISPVERLITTVEPEPTEPS